MSCRWGDNGIEGHMYVYLAVCLLKPLFIFPFETDVEKERNPEASWATYNISVHQEKERAEATIRSTKEKKRRHHDYYIVTI